MGRLRWQCRRGMLELDLVLEGFLDQAYPDLEPDQQVAFQRLLELDDSELWDLWRGVLPGADGVTQGLLEAMRHPR